MKINVGHGATTFATMTPRIVTLGHITHAETTLITHAETTLINIIITHTD